MNPDHIRVVLVGTTHPGNLGASARALKTMGLSRLVLADSACDPGAEPARANAAHADDVLASARREPTLDSAVADCALVVGLTARRRRLSAQSLDCRSAGVRIARESDAREVAIVFGREHSGLTNAEIDRCHLTIEIPANPRYPVLNLAAAVQVMCYEIRMANQAPAPRSARSAAVLASAEELERLHAHLETVVTRLGMYNPARPSRLMRLMRGLLARARPDRKEVAALRGILSRVEKRLED